MSGFKASLLGGVLLGTWRKSDVPDNGKKHAVVGFINARGILRTRIRPSTKHGESLADEYPWPHDPGRGWVIFEHIIFSDHLVGLNRFQVKEYTRLRSKAVPDETEDDRAAAEHAAVQEAVHRVQENPTLHNTTQHPVITYGVDLPKHFSTPICPERKRRRVGGRIWDC